MFTMYNGQTDPAEHMSHLTQRMTVHSKNEALMCKVFPSNLGPKAIRWFDGLGAGLLILLKKSLGCLDLALLHVVEFLSP